MSQTIKDWNPDEGDLCQGDVILFRLPDGMNIDTSQPILPRDNQLILAEGEITGHHHAIWFNPPMFRDDGLARAMEADFKPEQKQGVANLYRDDKTIQRLVTDGHLTTDRLAIGLLSVEGSPVVLCHQEHDAIRIPTGIFYVGRQQELNAGTIRQVSD